MAMRKIDREKVIIVQKMDSTIHLLNNGGQIYFVVCVNAAN